MSVGTCHRCRSALAPGDLYCATCGAPVAAAPPPRPDWRPPAQVLPAPPPGPPRSGPPPSRPGPPPPGRRTALLAGAVIGALVVAGGATAVVLGAGGGASVPAVATTAPSPVAEPARPSQPPRPSATATATGTPDDLLSRQLDTDAATVESLVGRWVPQLSSKRDGDVVDGTRYDAAAVLADFRSWQQRVPSSVLTRSERFTSFRTPDFWVTLAAEPFDTPEAANAWCEQQGLAPVDCFAKRLSHTDGPAGNSRPR